jgi:hypothetical protein
MFLNLQVNFIVVIVARSYIMYVQEKNIIIQHILFVAVIENIDANIPTQLEKLI